MVGSVSIGVEPIGRKFETNPENTDGVEGAVRRAVGLNHAEHAMQLPEDKERNEQMVCVPEALEATVLGASSLFHSEEQHRAQAYPHQPPGYEGPDGEVGGEEERNTLPGCASAGICHGKPVEIDDVGKRMDDTANNDGPARGFVEGDVFVKGDDIPDRRSPNDRDEISANGKQDEDNVDMENQSSCPCDSCATLNRDEDGKGCYYALKVIPNVARAVFKLSFKP
jgi:hypothetical protein